MFEAQLKQGVLLKKAIDAIRDIVADANFDCSPSGLSMQSMDRANVVLVVFQLKASAFDTFRCDRNVALGVSIGSLSKIMKCGNADDAITLKADDHGECIGIVFEDEDGGKVSDYELKLMDLDVARVQLPEDQYEAYIRIGSAEFQRVVKDLSNIDDSGIIARLYFPFSIVQVVVSKESVKFKCKGDMGSGCIVLKNSPQGKDEDANAIKILMRKPVTLSLSLKFLSQFTRATSLSPTVTLGMSSGVPMLVEYPFEDSGYLRFYLAPKVEDDDAMEEDAVRVKEEDNDDDDL